LRCAAWLVAASWTLAAAVGPALAERKVALVIGNAEYQHTRMLSNPRNDAEAIAALLRKIGFADGDVQLKLNLDYRSMQDEIRTFAARVSGADVALIYYAGHGIEVGGENYLVPIDAKLVRDLDLAFEAIRLETVLAVVGDARKLKLVIVDACRNNPLSDKIALRAGVTRQWTRGLSVVATKGDMMVAYAARAGTVALDGTGKHSPFAEALLKHMPTPGLDIYRMFGKVRETVLAATDQQQEPVVFGGAGGESIALVSAPTPPPPPKVVAPSGLLTLPPAPPPRTPKAGDDLSAEVVRVCAGLQNMTNLSMLRALAAKHKSTAAGSCIAARIEELEAVEQAKAADKKTVLVDPPKPAPTPKAPEAADKSPTPAPKAANFSTLKAHDGSAKAPDPASKAYDPPSRPYEPRSPPKLLAAPTASAPSTECDRLGASSDSPPQLGVKAVPFALLDATRAIPACQDAVTRYPADARLEGLLGRALHKAGRHAEARHWYEKAIEKADPLALNNLASMYESGQGVQTDHAKALGLYHRAVAAGNTFSLRNIGRMYEYGGGVPQDYATARSWYERAAQKGEPAGMHEIGRLYQEAKGVPQDFAIARGWYEKAAAKEYAPSMTSLGWFYETGRGGPQDHGLARSWYEKASAGGNSTATYNLAVLLARGGGIARDPLAAARHLLAAARAGNPTARRDLDGDMGAWADDVRRTLQDLLSASGDYRGGIGGWWDQASSDAARVYYMRSQ
jgi:TPR repeat protein